MEDNSRSRIQIRIADLSIEIEGSQAYVEQKLKDPESMNKLVMNMVTNMQLPAPTKGTGKLPEAKEERKPEKEKRRRAARKGTESYKMLPDLDLNAAGDVPSLGDFFRQKNPSSAMEINPVFVYYLKKIRNIDKVRLDHIYTCYKTVGAKVPSNLYQSVIDTGRRKGTVITYDMNDIKIGSVGENFVENNLP